MGAGDVKLAFLMGLVLGWPNILVALFLAFTLGAIVGLALILISELFRSLASIGEAKLPKTVYSLKSQIPFAPLLIIGTFVALFWGERLIGWYGGGLF
jgi:prepilin signal peptidase PulO-like enzyme (type II secretory pathway)